MKKKVMLILTSISCLGIICGISSCGENPSKSSKNSVVSSPSDVEITSAYTSNGEISSSNNPISSNSDTTSSSSQSSSTNTTKQTFIVTFNTNNHGSVNSVEIIEGNKLSQPSYDVSSFTNKVFNGWYFEESLINKVTFPLEVTSNITLYASFTTPISQGITFTKTLGYQEGIALEFNKVENVNNYSIYYKESGKDDLSYIKIDGMLIRDYSSYIRADILGLKQGQYDVKVVASNGINDLTNIYGEVTSINVISHLREGFAFTGTSCPGAYNFDGTLKSDAIILYATNENIETISLNNGKATFTGLGNILSGTCLKNLSKPLCVRVIGNITNSNIVNNGLVIDGNKMAYSKGITLEGVGNDAAFKAGIMFKGTKFGEVRNLASYENESAKDDAFGFEQTNDYVWAHNLDIFYGKNLGGDKAKGDGSLDCKSTDHVTISYVHFYDSGKANLLGMGEDSGHYASYHHNYYDNADSRMPRVRDYSVHVYNNYYKNIAKYCIGNAKSASIFSENNYFDNVKYPYISGSQGHDIKSDGSSTLSSEKGGITKAYGDYFSSSATKTSFQDDPINFDYYQASSRDEIISSTISGKGSRYNNFDTSSDFYTYNVESALEAKNSVLAYAGRVEKGDISYEFTNYSFDDPLSYTRDSNLDTILLSYSSKMVKAGLGDKNDVIINGSGGVSPITPTDPDTPSKSEISENTTIDLSLISDSKLSNYNYEGLIITGNKKTGASFTYDGKTYTTGIKMESSTSISFTITNNMKVDVISDGSDGKKIKFDDSKIALSNNIASSTLQKGTHTITKGDSINIYLIIFTIVE